jgi:Tfp pilus assembly protein PilF
MMIRRAVLALLVLLLASACSRPESESTPLPTKERSIGRVQQGLQKADEDAARRREQLERATEGADDKPAKSISSGY